MWSWAVSMPCCKVHQLYFGLKAISRCMGDAPSIWIHNCVPYFSYALTLIYLTSATDSSTSLVLTAWAHMVPKAAVSWVCAGRPVDVVVPWKAWLDGAYIWAVTWFTTTTGILKVSAKDFSMAACCPAGPLQQGYILSFDTLQSGVWSQLWLIKHPGLKAQVIQWCAVQRRKVLWQPLLAADLRKSAGYASVAACCPAGTLQWL